MNKMVRYELCRMVCSKVFLGMLCILSWYGWQILNGETILGVAHTAPFSPWSFGSYLSSVMPVLSLSFLFFLWETCSGPAKQVEILADATLLGHEKLMLAKAYAVGLAWTLLVLAVSALGIGFLVFLFGDAVPVLWLLSVMVLETVPVLLFLEGMGLFAGRFHPGLVFLIIPVTVLFTWMPLPMGAQLFSWTFFSVWPAGLELDPAFLVPWPVAAGKTFFAAVGLLGAAAAMRKR